MNIRVTLSAFVFLLIIAGAFWSGSIASDLPPHIVADDSPLPPKAGRRVQINSQDSDLTREECRLLIAAYRDRAAPDGQVSVHKPSELLNGELMPWCVENFDGRGIRFNDNMF